MKNFVSFFLLLHLFNQHASTTYKIQYKLTYKPDSTNLQRVDSESFMLYSKDNKRSFYGSENFLKKDSISALIKKGILSDYDVVGNSKNRFKTKFSQFIVKDYQTKTVELYETIGLLPYSFSVKNVLIWKINAEHDTLSGYPCIKATTNYAGRAYEAWFTPEVPISDGPYVFWGLPGLIVKLRDTRDHYVFSLERLSEFNGPVSEMPTYRKQQPTRIDRDRAFALREDNRKDPLGHLERTTGHSTDGMTFQRSGASERVPARLALTDRSWDNNPLELK